MLPKIPLNDLARHAREFPEGAEHVARVLGGGWYVLGQSVAAFEQAFAAYCGVAECVAVANGTDAIELALRALDIGADDHVVTCANAGGYSTTAIRAIGARPVYVDVRPDTLAIDPAALAAAVAKQRVAAVIVTHLYGRLAGIAALKAVCEDARIPLIEDCAQSHGASRAGKRAGSFGTIGCFSFYPTKNLGCAGDGGAVTTSDAALAARVRQLRQYGWGAKYEVVVPRGRNSRLDELQAALLLAKLPHLDRWNQRRRDIAARYAEGIRHADVEAAAPTGDDDVAHLYVVRAKARAALKAHLTEQGVVTDVHYPIPDHRQPAYASEFTALSLPHTERACAEVLTLPCYPELTDAEVDRVIAACNAAPVTAMDRVA